MLQPRSCHFWDFVYSIIFELREEYIRVSIHIMKHTQDQANSTTSIGVSEKFYIFY